MRRRKGDTKTTSLRDAFKMPFVPCCPLLLLFVRPRFLLCQPVPSAFPPVTSNNLDGWMDPFSFTDPSLVACLPLVWLFAWSSRSFPRCVHVCLSLVVVRFARCNMNARWVCLVGCSSSAPSSLACWPGVSATSQGQLTGSLVQRTATQFTWPLGQCVKH